MQNAYPDFDPNMMWNLKYGDFNHSQMMGGNNGMMGGDCWDTTVPIYLSTEMNVAPEKAIEDTQKYIDTNIKGANAANLIKFYGYFAIDFEKDGKDAGMLSVNGYSGQVFLHTWHGTFIEESAMQ